MKKTLLLLMLAVVSTSLFAQKGKPAKVELKNAIDSINYAQGMLMAANLKKQLDTDLNIDLVIAGLTAAFTGNGTAITPVDATSCSDGYNTKVAQPRISARWKADNAKFLDDNKSKPGIISTASGLQYEVLTRGSGTVSPKSTDVVEVHYHGTLIDGQVFDSSVKRNKTSTFGLSQVISGWTEGLQYMKVGDKFRFYIPYNLAYGEQARPNSIIKGFSTLIFEVELFKIQAPEANAADNTKQAGTGQAAIANEKALGQAFLTENKKRPGVVTTASGLQYEIMTKGTGTVSPKATDKVKVHYHGTLLNGQIFDSSVQRGEPISFGLGQVIKGWTEGLQLMKEGDKFKFFIPNELAYGERTPGAGIPAGAALIFEVELFKVNP